jgi:hypothetical protein
MRENIDWNQHQHGMRCQDEGNLRGIEPLITILPSIRPVPSLIGDNTYDIEPPTILSRPSHASPV